MRFPVTHGVDVKQALQQGWTIPASWYFDPAILDAERRNIFAPAWHYVAHVGELAESGSFVATEVNDVPVVVLRDREGQLRGYLNICPHRAHQVAKGSGRRQTLQCGYHAWTFNLDGTLRSAPRSECEPDFDKSEVSLLPVGVGQWGPLVFVNVSPDPTPFEDALEGLPLRAKEMDLAFDEYEFWKRRVAELQCNWKVFLDNATECYHCEPVHSADFADRFSTVTEDFQGNLVFGERCFSYSIPYKDPSKRGAHDFQLYFAWPSFLLLAEQTNMYYAIRMEPSSATSTRLVVDYFFHRTVAPEDREAELAMWVSAAEDDVVANESVQRGLNSNRLPQGRFFLQEEGLLGHIQTAVYDAIKDDLPEAKAGAGARV